MSKGKGIRTTTVIMSQVYCKTWTSFDVNPAKREKEEDQDSQRYGETWTRTSNQLRRIEAAEMKLLRPLAGYTLYDRKRNTDIRT
ncbi:hypothetical protein C0J52_27135 [Blattella germanica]|nr:hypothetical protein C0J52_27135 [Blattella germanica]